MLTEPRNSTCLGLHVTDLGVLLLFSRSTTSTWLLQETEQVAFIKTSVHLISRMVEVSRSQRALLTVRGTREHKQWNILRGLMREGMLKQIADVQPASVEPQVESSVRCAQKAKQLKVPRLRELCLSMLTLSWNDFVMHRRRQ